jgi:hypothetical protein
MPELLQAPEEAPLTSLARSGRAVAASLVLVVSAPINARGGQPAQPAKTPSAAAAAQSAPSTATPGKKKKKKNGKSSKTVLTADARLDFIRRAQIWAPTNIPEMNLREGPQGPGAFQPNEMVTCDYVETKLPGTSRKFDCAITPTDEVKVRYGETNGKVEGSVLASRLLWALGFGADRLYPVRVTCRGCSPDPWVKRARVEGEHVFDPAAIERKPVGHEMKSKDKGGWAWPELDLVDEGQGGAAKAQRDALKLLAVFMQHTDSKAEQERLLCLPGGLERDGACDKPFMLIHDGGLTFGHANYLNLTKTGSVNFDEWSRTPIWRDRATCVAHMSRSVTGTLGDPKISEAGRAFLASLLNQLSDKQLEDLFDVAGVAHRSRKPNSAEPAASTEEWVSAFSHKRDQISNTRCPS